MRTTRNFCYALVVLVASAASAAQIVFEPVAPVRADGYSPEEAAEWVATKTAPDGPENGTPLVGPQGYDSVDELVDGLGTARRSTYGDEFGNTPARNSGIVDGELRFGTPKRIDPKTPILISEDGRVWKASCLNPLLIVEEEEEGGELEPDPDDPVNPIPPGVQRVEVVVSGQVEHVHSGTVRMDCGGCNPQPGPRPTDCDHPEWRGPGSCRNCGPIRNCNDLVRHLDRCGGGRQVPPRPVHCDLPGWNGPGSCQRCGPIRDCSDFTRHLDRCERGGRPNRGGIWPSPCMHGFRGPTCASGCRGPARWPPHQTPRPGGPRRGGNDRIQWRVGVVGGVTYGN